MSINYNSADTANTINRAIDNSMGLTTTDQGASSAGLIIKEDLQPVVQCTNGFDYAVTVKEFTGVPPLSFHSMGQVLQWSLDGNTDSGNSVGDKTSNLINNGNIEQGGWSAPSGSEPVKIENYLRCRYSEFFTVQSNKVYYDFKDLNVNMVMMDANGLSLGGSDFKTGTGNYTFIDGTKKITLIIANTDSSTPIIPSYVQSKNITLDYGYDVPIVVNDTDTYHCYITDVLRKSSGDTPVYDTMNSDGTIIRRVDTDGTPLEEPTEETYTAPSVEVPWGNNTVDVDTTVTPSSMYIKYKDN